MSPSSRKIWIAVWLACVLPFPTLTLLRHCAGWNPRDLLAVRPDFRDVVEGIDLELDLRNPPAFAGKAVLRLRKGTKGPLPLVLNRRLEIESVTDETGKELDVGSRRRLRSDYFTESTALTVEIPQPTKEIQVRYSGRGMDGSEKKDWMGILLLADDELRMSGQTAFYPQIPEDLDSPRQIPWPSRLRVLAPERFEAYAPGKATPWDHASPGGRAWSWESEVPTTLSFFAAERVRRDTQVGEARVATLLTPEHTGLGESVAVEVEKMLRFYALHWGEIGARTLGVVEMKSRGKNSYNWVSDGIIVMEYGALTGDAPIDSLAHEVAHLWWGQEVRPYGRGERFLNESLAEYSSWRFLQESQGDGAAQAQRRAAEHRWWEAVHKTGSDPALFDVRFRSEGYQDLAYAKGPAALWRLHERLGAKGMDALLRAYRSGMSENREAKEDAAEVFLQALREAAPQEEAAAHAALFGQTGHAHFEPKEIAFDGSKVRGRISFEPCPRGIPVPNIPSLRMAIATESAEAWHEIALDEKTSTSFEIEAGGEALAWRLDTRLLPLGRYVAAAIRPDKGFLSSEPADGARDLPLGPLVFRLRFGSPLAAPAEAFRKEIQQSCNADSHEGKSPYLSILSLGLEDEGKTLAVSIDGTMPEREHVLSVPEGLTTRRGFFLPAVSLRFETQSAVGLPRPRIIETDPPHDAQGVPVTLARIKVVFSEPMRSGQGFRTPLIAELERDGWTKPRLRGYGSWEDEKTLVWELEETLEKGKRYGLPFEGNYISKLGLRLERFDLRFETEP